MVAVVPSTAVSALLAVLLAVLTTSEATAPSRQATGPLRYCPPEKFNCNNGKCISGSRWCDGIDDCDNNADELSCRICLSNSLKCKGSTQCVPAGARCNGMTECLDGSDENGCEALVQEQTVSTKRPVVQEIMNTTENGAPEHVLSITVLISATVSYLFR